MRIGDPDPKYGLCFQGPKNYFSVSGLGMGWLDVEKHGLEDLLTSPKNFLTFFLLNGFGCWMHSLWCLV